MWEEFRALAELLGGTDGVNYLDFKTPFAEVVVREWDLDDEFDLDVNCDEPSSSTEPQVASQLVPQDEREDTEWKIQIALLMNDK